MTERKQQRFAPHGAHGALAVDPKAFGELFDTIDADADPGEVKSDVVVVTIRGPLMHHHDFCFDSYEAIKERVALALALKPKFVLMSIDSPGGLVSGAFDTARELRAMSIEAGVDLYAHVGGRAASAAYAIASAAMWIGVSRSAMLGSIGVVDTMVDITAQNQILGLNVEIVTSGARKADGNPNVEITDDAVAAVQRRVDTLAAMFFDLVSEHGWGTPDKLRALEAVIVTGEQAVQLGLASEVATLDQSIAFALPESMRTGTGATATDNEQGRYNMATTEEDAVASLRKMAEGDDEDEARKAKAALKALGFGDEDDDDDAKGEDDDDAKGEDDDDDDAKAKAEDDDDDAKAEDDEDEDAKAEDDEDAKATSVGGKALALARTAMAEVHNLKAASAKKVSIEKRTKLLATRPDLAPDMVALLSDPDMSNKQVKSFLKTLAVGPTRGSRVAALATATGTRGEGQGDGTGARLPPEEKAALDVAMGLSEMTTETVNTPHRLSFGVRRVATKKGS